MSQPEFPPVPPRVWYGPVPRYGHATDPRLQHSAGPPVRPPNSPALGPIGPPSWVAPPGYAPGGYGPPGYGQPSYGQSGYGQSGYGPAREPTDPARTLGIVGLVLSVFCSTIGLAICVVAIIRSRRAGHVNVPAIVGLAVGVVLVVVSIVFRDPINDTVTCLITSTCS